MAKGLGMIRVLDRDSLFEELCFTKRWAVATNCCYSVVRNRNLGIKAKAMVDSASSRGKEADHSSLKVVLLRVYKDPMAFIAIKAYSCRRH